MCLFRTGLMVGYSVGMVVNNMVLVIEALAAVDAIGGPWVGTRATSRGIT